MKRKLCVTTLIMCILCIFQLNAQTTKTKTIGIGGGTSTVLPMATNQASYHSQQIYTKNELEIPAGSTITSLSFNVSSVPKDKNNATCNITVSLKNIESTSFANNAFESTSGSSTATMTGKFSASEWVMFDCTDFTYEGHSLLVDFQGTVANTKNITAVTFVTNTSGVAIYSNTANATTGTSVTGTNQIQLEYVAPPAAPTGLTATATGTSSIALSWNRVADATSYKVYQNGTEVATVATNSYNAEGLNAGTNYCYTVKAVNSYNGESVDSNSACATTWIPQPPTVPTNLQATAGGESVSLTWNAAERATSYRVYNGNTLVAENVQGTSYVVTGLTAGTNYCFTVTAVNIAGESAPSNQACATAQEVQKYRIRVSTGSHDNYGDYLNINSYNASNNSSTVGVSAKTESNSQIFILEEAGNGNKYIRNVDGYYIKCDDIDYVYVSETEKTPLALQYTDQDNFYIRDYDKSTTMFSGQNYFEVKNNLVYCWANQNGGNTVTWTLELVSTAPAAPVLAAEALSHDKISLSWNAVDGAIKYNVYDGNGSLIAENITATSYVVTDLNPETNYCYTVTAINAKAEESEHSNKACTATDAAPVFPAPTNLQATVTNGTTITLTWNTVDGAVKYNVYTGSNVVAATNNTYTFMGNANTRYCFTVTAIDGEGTESAKSEEVCAATIPAAPTNLKATAGGKSVNLTWYSVGVAESYNIYNADDTFVGNVKTPSYTVEGLTTTEYCYKVTAVNAAGESGYSNQACATPTGLEDETITIGNGDAGSATYFPIWTEKSYSYSQQFYTKEDVNPNGKYNGEVAITSISFYVTEISTDMPTRKVRVYLSNESEDITFGLDEGTYPNHPLKNLTGLVFEGDVTFTEGWVKINFTTPFQYTGNGLLVTVMNDTGAIGSNNRILFRNHITYPSNTHDYRVNRTIYGTDSGRIDPTKSRTGTNQEYRNDIQLTFNSGVVFPVVGAPQNLTATAANDTEIDLSWDPAQNATNYNIYFREDGDSEFRYLTNVTGLSYRAKGLLLATEYCFIVTGANGTVESPDSNVACAKTEDTDGCTVVFTLTDNYRYPEYAGWKGCYLNVEWTIDGRNVSKHLTLESGNEVTHYVEIPSGYDVNVTYIVANGLSSNADFHSRFGFTMAYQGADDFLVNAQTGTFSYVRSWSNISVDCSLEFIHDGDWDEPSNWNQNRVPNEGEFVLISADAEINRDVTVKAVTINTVIDKIGSITLKANNSLTVTGDFKNADSSRFVIYDGAQVFQDNDDVMATFEMNVKAPTGELEEFNKTGWQFIASPMKNALTANFEKEGVGYDLFKYDGNVATTEDLEWINYKGHADFEIIFQQGRGYMASYHTEGIAEFTGLLNYETSYRFSDKLKYHGDDDKAQIDNFHLLGNPFTFDMDWSKVTSQNLATGYAVITTDGNWSYETSGTNGTIKVGDGFFVKVTADDPILNYNVATATRSRSADNDSRFINIIASSKAGKDNVIINFANDGREGFDKLENFNSNIAEIYVKENDRRYGILNYDENVEEVELYFNAHKMGEYTINAVSNADYASVVLVDRLTGVETNLLVNSYTFKSMTDDNHDRFVLRMSNDAEEGFVYRTGDELVVCAEGKVQILDVMGRVVYNGYIDSENHRINVSTLNNAAYIVRVVNANEVKTQKVVIW